MIGCCWSPVVVLAKWRLSWIWPAPEPMVEKNTKMERGDSREYLAVILTIFPPFRTDRKCLKFSFQDRELSRKCLTFWPGIKRILFSKSRARCHSIRFGAPKKASYRVCDFLIRSSPSGRQFNASHNGDCVGIFQGNRLLCSFFTVCWTKDNSIRLYGGNTN